MIEFKEEFVFKGDTSLVLYKDSTSIVFIIIKEFEIDIKKKSGRKRFCNLFKQFYEFFMEDLFDACDDETIDSLDEILPTQQIPKDKKLILKFINDLQINKDEIFRKSYLKFKSEALKSDLIEHRDNIDDSVGDLEENFLESIEANTPTSATLGLFSILFSSSYRYMSDYEVKLAVKKKIIIWVLILIIGIVFAYFLSKLL
ncbi:MAG: hypothetical protein Q8M15_02105 [Bacteroidota bacterium]|nr:hypothetical protein [Bacteroidota bacterium]